MSAPKKKNLLLRATTENPLLSAVVAIVIALIGAGFTIVIDPGGDDPHKTVTVVIGGGTSTSTTETPPETLAVPTESKVDTGDSDKKPDTTIKAPVGAAQDAAESPEIGVEGEGLRDETPAGVPASQLEENARLLEDAATGPLNFPLASPQKTAGCVDRFVVNRSSRNGVRPTVIVLHYTVSHNIAGWGDVNSIVNLFNTASFQASSNYVLDAEGHCARLVLEGDKAWTQAGGNPWAISFEIIDYGSEKRLLDPAGYRKLAKVIGGISQRWNIPIRRGAISGCAPSRSGIVQHKDGGSCWGGHHDITPFSINKTIGIVKRTLHPPCRTQCRMSKRHANVHKAINAKCHGKPARTHKRACKKLRARNSYMHGYAKKHHFTLT